MDEEIKATPEQIYEANRLANWCEDDIKVFVDNDAVITIDVDPQSSSGYWISSWLYVPGKDEDATED